MRINKLATAALLITGLLGCSLQPTPVGTEPYSVQLQKLRTEPKVKVSETEAWQAILNAVASTSSEYWKRSLPPAILAKITTPNGEIDVSKVRLEHPLVVHSWVSPSTQEVLRLADLLYPQANTTATRLSETDPAFKELREKDSAEFAAMTELLALSAARSKEIFYGGYYLFLVGIEEGYIGEIYVSALRLATQAPNITGKQYPAPKAQRPYLSQKQAAQIASTGAEGSLVSPFGFQTSLTSRALWIFDHVVVDAETGRRYRLVREEGIQGLTVYEGGFRLPYTLKELP